MRAAGGACGRLCGVRTLLPTRPWHAPRTPTALSPWQPACCSQRTLQRVQPCVLCPRCCCCLHRGPKLISPIIGHFCAQIAHSLISREELSRTKKNYTELRLIGWTFLGFKRFAQKTPPIGRINHVRLWRRSRTFKLIHVFRSNIHTDLSVLLTTI